jgi:hypothetical protein
VGPDLTGVGSAGRLSQFRVQMTFPGRLCVGHRVNRRPNRSTKCSMSSNSTSRSSSLRKHLGRWPCRFLATPSPVNTCAVVQERHDVLQNFLHSRVVREPHAAERSRSAATREAKTPIKPLHSCWRNIHAHRKRRVLRKNTWHRCCRSLFSVYTCYNIYM